MYIGLVLVGIWLYQLIKNKKAKTAMSKSIKYVGYAGLALIIVGSFIDNFNGTNRQDQQATETSKVQDDKNKKQVEELNNWYNKEQKQKFSDYNSNGTISDDEYAKYKVIKGFKSSGDNLLVVISNNDLEKNNLSKKDVAKIGFNNILGLYPSDKLSSFSNLDDGHLKSSQVVNIENYVYLD